MTDTPEKRYENGYRLSEATLKVWSRITFTIMGIGLAGLTIVIIITASMYGNAPVEDIPAMLLNLMWVFGVIALGLPLLLGAIIGGLAIHRLGWIPLLVMILGICAVGLSRVDGYGYLSPYGFIAIGVGVLGIFLLAIFRTKVDIWFGLPMLNSPRWYVRGRDKRQDAEEAEFAALEKLDKQDKK